jgi:hypothetical protein
MLADRLSDATAMIRQAASLRRAAVMRVSARPYHSLDAA